MDSAYSAHGALERNPRVQQAIQRIDHVVILVRQENALSYADRLSTVLGIAFEEPFVTGSKGTLVIVSWDAGIEIIAPTRPEGPHWERLQRFGEGCVSILFGVADLDDGMARATANGATVAYEATLSGEEAWLKRFSRFREASLNVFDTDVACVFGLSEIVPRTDAEVEEQ